MFQDEARFGRINALRACWAPKPMRPEVLKQIVREYVWVFGAVSPMDGRHDSLVLPRANTAAMSLFLKEVSDLCTGEYILMFVDKAGWHRSKDLEIPPNIELAFLPPYSPELNPQEQVWDELREKHFANKTFATLEEVVDAAVNGLRRLEASPAAIARLTYRKWLNP
jgi:hypothetical protein